MSQEKKDDGESSSRLTLKPDSFYKEKFSKRRYGAREWIIAEQNREMPWLEKIQEKLMNPMLTELCKQTALLGTHTFFMVFIPFWFFIGKDEFGRELILTLATCIVVTGYLKDWLAVPRPHSSKLKQMSLSTHAMEYGFPSTHSATTISMGFAFESMIQHLENPLPLWALLVWRFFLIVTSISITFGRMYLGMHTFLDVSVGTLLGYLCWEFAKLLQRIFDGMILSEGRWVFLLTFYPVSLVVPLVRMKVYDPCVCFDDTVAFVGAVAGTYFGFWYNPSGFRVHTPGDSFRTESDVFVFAGIAFLKFISGAVYSVIGRIIIKWLGTKVFRGILKRKHHTRVLSPKNEDDVKFMTKYCCYFYIGLNSLFMPQFFLYMGWSRP